MDNIGTSQDDGVATVRLSNGVEAAAKNYKGRLFARTYANLTQARALQQKLGPAWDVRCYGRPFFVCRVAS